MVRIRNIVVALFVVMLIGGTACAQDKLDYSGPYIGAFVGHSWVNLEYSEPSYPEDALNPDMNGFVGGLYFGHNYRIDNLVLGFETDAGLCDLSEGADDDNSFNTWSAFDIDWDAHLRARAGFVYNTTLFYVAGGLALAKVDVDDTDSGYGGDNAIHAGWTIGAGIEQKITEHLTARFEYLYDDYGSESYSIEVTGFAPYQANVDLEIHTARIGLAYSF
ncbi:MAG: outer membrane protein [Pedobacter sp.]